MNGLWRRPLFALCLTFSVLPRAMASEAAPTEEVVEEDGMATLSLEELMTLQVVSASNRGELLADAPATVIVISGNEIEARGYRDLSEILDDLPGMQVIRPYGDTWLKNYMRGFRNHIGDPFLVLVDGLTLNHLYYNTADVIAALPLGNIERVEVVYGPASSVYGANAFMGVINVITRKPVAEGLQLRAELSGDTFDAGQADLYLSGKRGAFTFTLAARGSGGGADLDGHERYEYSRDRYFADRALWGGFAGNPDSGGRYHSPRRHLGMDLRAGYKLYELGIQYFGFDSGYGLVYAADRVQNNAVWKRPDFSVFLRRRQEIGSRLKLESLARYRNSGLAEDANFLESYPGSPAAPAQTVVYSYWRSRNSSWTFSQSADFQWTEKFLLCAGLRYEKKNLQKAYDLSYGPAVAATTIDVPEDYPFPPKIPAVPVADNRTQPVDVGGYLQGRYGLDASQQLHLGVRLDRNSFYGTTTSLRAGYSGNFGPWGLKALYGEAYQEPSPRLLYGGWTGSGSDPDLQPERSKTTEISGSYASTRARHLLSFYHIKNLDTITNSAGGATNLGEREVLGADYVVQAEIGKDTLPNLSVWGGFSLLFRADEKLFSPTGATLGRMSTGDLARQQLHAGIQARFTGRLSGSLRGRYVSGRDTVPTNPVRRVPGFATFDTQLTVTRIGLRGLSASLGVYNLTDAAYEHPGVREANAGTTPGRFDAAGVWQGSGGYFNSLLVQPGRSFRLSLRLQY